MSLQAPHRIRAWWIGLVLAILQGGGLASPGLSQGTSHQTPDLATLESQFEEAFQMALEMPAESRDVVFAGAGSRTDHDPVRTGE